MSEIRTNIMISGESFEYRSTMDISIVTLNNTLIDTHSSFRTNVNISTALNDGSVSQIQTTLELNNVALQFYLVDMTKLNQSILYFSKFFNMYFEPEVMWELLAQGTNEQINISHLSNALSKYTLLDTTVSLIKTIESVGTNLNTHKIDDSRHFTIDEKEFLLNLMENPNIIGTGGGLFEKVIINQDNNVIPAVRPIKQENKNSGIISNTFISCKGIDVTSATSGGAGGLTRFDLFNILTSEPLNTDEYINEKFLKLDKITEEILKHEKDPTVPQHVKEISKEKIESWDLVASLFKVSEDNTYIYLNNNRGLMSNSFISCKGLDTSSNQSGVIDINLIWYYLQQETSEQINKSHLVEALSKYVTEDWITNQGYLKEFTEQDPTVPSYIKKITKDQIDNWDLIVSLFGLSEDGTYVFIKNKRGFVSESFISCKGLDTTTSSDSYIDMNLIWYNLQQETSEQINISHLKDALYNYATKDWVNLQGFISNFTETDPTVPSYIKSISKEEINNWNLLSTLFSINDEYILINNNRGLVSNSFISCKGIDDSSSSASGMDIDLLWYYLQLDSSEQINISHLQDALSEYPTIDWINSQGYLSNFVETDPTVPTHVKKITADQIFNWDLAASLFGVSKDDSYVYTTNNRGFVSNAFISCKGLDESTSSGGGVDMDLVWYFLSQEGNNQIHSSHLEDALKNYTTKDWVNAQGYLKNFTEKDPTVPSYVKTITQTQLDSWDLVASLFSLIEDSYILVNNNRGFVVNSYISCKGIDNNASQIDSSFNREYLFDILSGNPGYGEYINIEFLDLSDYITVIDLDNKGYITKGTNLAHYGITDAYTKNQIDNKFANFLTTNTPQTIEKAGAKIFKGAYGEDIYIGGTKSGISIDINAANGGFARAISFINSADSFSDYVQFGVYGDTSVGFKRAFISVGEQQDYNNAILNIYTDRIDVAGKASFSKITTHSEGLEIGDISVTKQTKNNTEYIEIDGNLVVTGAISFGGFGEGGSTGGGITTVTKDMVIDALGYTPYNATNPNGYITSSALNGYATTSWVNSGFYSAEMSRIANTVLAAPNGSAGSATFRKLVSADIPNLDWSKITSGKPTTLSGYGITNAYTKSEADSTFLGINGKAVNSDKLDGYHYSDVLNNTLKYGYKDATLNAIGWYRIAKLTGYGSYMLSISGSYQNVNSTSASFIINKSYTSVKVSQIGAASIASMVTSVRVVKDASTASIMYVEVYMNSPYSGQPFAYKISPLRDGLNNANYSMEMLDATATTNSLTELAKVDIIVDADVYSASKLATSRTIWGQSFDGTEDVNGDLTINDATGSSAKSYKLRFLRNSKTDNYSDMGIYAQTTKGLTFFQSTNGTDKDIAYITIEGNFVTNGSITFGSASDRRLKDNIKSMTDKQAVAVLSALNPVTFSWNSTAYELGKLSGVSDGFIADEYEKLIPNSGRDIWANYRAINYERATGYLVKGWQKHQSEIERLKDRVKELENELKQYKYGTV